MPKPPSPVRPATPRPPDCAKKPAAVPRAPRLTTPLSPDEAKRMAAVLMAMLKE